MNTKIVVPFNYVCVDGYQHIINMSHIASVSLRNEKYWDNKNKCYLTEFREENNSWWRKLISGMDTRTISISHEYVAVPPAVIIGLKDGKELKFTYDCRQDAIDAVASVMLQIHDPKVGETIFYE